MGKWEIVRLGDACCKTDNENPAQYDKDIVYYDISSVDSECKKITSRNVIPSKDAPSRARQKVFYGDILVSTVRPNLNAVAVVEQKSDDLIASTGFCVLRPDTQRVNKEYLFQYVQSPFFVLSMTRQATGASYPAVSNKIVMSEEIPLPPLPVQQQIADVLDCASTIIVKRKAQIEKLDLLVKSQFIEIFGDPVTNPKGWDRKALAKECDVITGNTPSRAISNYYGDYIEWIKSDNINTPDMYLTQASEMLSEAGLSVGRCVESGAILMTCIAGSISCIGNVAISDRTVSFNQQINAVIPKSNNVFYMYYLFLLSKTYIQSTVNMSLKGILSKGKMLELEFPFPPTTLQNEFSDFVQQVEAQKALLQQSLEKLERNYKSMMQKCFSGEMF